MVLSQALDRSTPPSHIISWHRADQQCFQASHVSQHSPFNAERKQGSYWYHLCMTFGMSQPGIEPSTFRTPGGCSTTKPQGLVSEMCQNAFLSGNIYVKLCQYVLSARKFITETACWYSTVPEITSKRAYTFSSKPEHLLQYGSHLDILGNITLRKKVFRFGRIIIFLTLWMLGNILKIDYIVVCFIKPLNSVCFLWEMMD